MFIWSGSAESKSILTKFLLEIWFLDCLFHPLIEMWIKQHIDQYRNTKKYPWVWQLWDKFRKYLFQIRHLVKPSLFPFIYFFDWVEHKQSIVVLNQAQCLPLASFVPLKISKTTYFVLSLFKFCLFRTFLSFCVWLKVHKILKNQSLLDWNVWR